MDKTKSGTSLDEAVLEELNGSQEQDKESEPVSDDSSSESSDSQGIEKKDESESSSPNDKVYKTLDGREVTADQLFEEYDHLARDYTRKTQELSQLKKSRTEETNEKSGEGASESESESLSASDKAVLDELKRLGIVTESDIEKAMSEWENKVVSKAAKVTTSQMELKTALDELVKDYDFVERDKILNFIVENPNTSLSLLDIARSLYYDEFVKREMENAPLKGRLPETEEKGVGDTEPVKPKYRFKDGSAERAVRELLNGK